MTTRVVRMRRRTLVRPQQIDSHEHCWHVLRGPVLMVIKDGHIVQKCCKCDTLRQVHADHALGGYDGH